jgi:response regulator RpfG family c-di-GMP phosphodiesterase
MPRATGSPTAYRLPDVPTATRICQPSPAPGPATPPDGRDLSPEAESFLGQLLELQLVPFGSVERFLEQHTEHLAEYRTPERLGEVLVHAGLLTGYQLDRILAGKTHGLVLGNHRVLDRLGAGAMGVVFRAEHLLLKRQAAIKVLPVDDDCQASLLERFYGEMHVLADLHHPNIVLAFDAGQLQPPGPNSPPLLYLVMELVPGNDLEKHVHEYGPVDIAQACDWIRQAACGLQEAHDRHLIHRDVKPSNLLLSEQGQVKVGDFGLARQFCSRLTDPRGLLGTLEYMAPEQSCDPSAVDGKADIYGLGATLFWLLTGQPPYPRSRSVSEALRMLQNGRARRLQELRPDAPVELDDLVARMLDPDPKQRPALPLTVMNALLPFTTRLRSEAQGGPSAGAAQDTSFTLGASSLAPAKRVLLVDDEISIRMLARAMLEPLGCVCEEAETGSQALGAIRKQPFDLLLLDLNLPDLDGYEICRRLRERPPWPNLKVIVVSGRGDHDQLAEALPQGADDYIPKPFGIHQLTARVQHALCLKEAEDQADFLARQLTITNRQLENSLTARIDDVRRAQDALLFAMAKMAESKDGETSGHLRRLQSYTHCLGARAAEEPTWAAVITAPFLEQLERCVPLHDIGKIGLPEQVLLKPGKLTDSERMLMETHTIIGDQILDALRLEHGESLSFLGMASAIVRHHHERYDGQGYPDRLAGDAIPLAARLVAIADVYDALRRPRCHKPALSHEEAAHILLQKSAGQFDPGLLRIFAACQDEFARIYHDIRT